METNTNQEGFFSIVKKMVKDSKTGESIEKYFLAELMFCNGQFQLVVFDNEIDCSWWGPDWCPLTEEARQTFIMESEGFITNDNNEQIWLMSWEQLYRVTSGTVI